MSNHEQTLQLSLLLMRLPVLPCLYYVTRTPCILFNYLVRLINGAIKSTRFFLNL